jgi:hypothetical protein
VKISPEEFDSMYFLLQRIKETENIGITGWNILDEEEGGGIDIYYIEMTVDWDGRPDYETGSIRSVDIRSLKASQDELIAYAKVLAMEKWLLRNQNSHKSTLKTVECKQKQIVVMQAANEDNCLSMAIATIQKDVRDLMSSYNYFIKERDSYRAEVKKPWFKHSKNSPLTKFLKKGDKNI